MLRAEVAAVQSVLGAVDNFSSIYYLDNLFSIQYLTSAVSTHLSTHLTGKGLSENVCTLTNSDILQYPDNVLDSLR